MLTNSEYFQNAIQSSLKAIGLELTTSSWQFSLVAICCLLIVAGLVYTLARLILHFKVSRLAHLTKTNWDDELVSHGVFRRLSHIFPGIVLYFGNYLVLPPDSAAFSGLALVSSIYLVFGVYWTSHAVLNACEAIYNQSRLADKAPITGFVQVSKLLLTLIMIFLLISLLLDKSPIYLLSGLTAVAAVLLLIFRDTILGFVAGIQIAANRMFNTGDWIEVPKYQIDGEIVEIGLTVAKVQNWDKTISTIPTYNLTSEAVKNWRGMEDSGGRRIKRALHIDLRSIHFATKDDLEKWQKLTLLKQYLADKTQEIALYDNQQTLSADEVLNSRKLTNIGTYRAYVNEYLKNHPDIHTSLTKMARQLAPSEIGLPIQIYCFSQKQDWVEYEQLQGDIFDHLLSMLPIFGLRVYQRIASDDKLKQNFVNE